MVDVTRSQVFGDDAETYDATRPGYPGAVIDMIVDGDPATALDVGCGTGKAARAVTARGVDVLGLEPDARMADIARRHGVDVTVSTFEAWQPVHRDLVFSGQAWHWVDPVRGASQVAGTLTPGGRWAAFWNRERDPTVAAALDDAYRRQAPQLLEERWTPDADQAMDELITAGFAATGAFGPLERHEIRWTDELTVATFVARLSTRSSHRLLEHAEATRLHAAIVDGLGAPDTMIQVGYTTLVLTTLRR